MKYRILIISAAYPPSPGGVATHVTNLVHGLLKQESDFFISVLTTREQPKIYPFSEKGRLQVWGIKEKNVPNFCGRRAPFEDPISFVMEKWHEIRADLIHAHDLDSTYIGWMLKVAFKVPLVMTVHRAPTEWKTERYKESPKDCFMEAIRIFKLANYIVVPSKASYKVLKSQGFEKKIEVIPHGINYKYLSSFSEIPGVLSQLNLATPDTIFILCPVRADEHKSPDTFIKAAEYLKRRNPDRKFVFLLTDEPTGLYSYIPGFAATLGLRVNEEIFFKKFDYRQMPTLYRRANVCVIPSLRESFGQTVLEAFVFYAPVVAANAAALPEIVHHNKNGLLFNADSSADLTKQVEKILFDQKLADDLTKKGFGDIKKKYNAQRMIKQYVKLYKRVIREYASQKKRPLSAAFAV